MSGQAPTSQASAPRRGSHSAAARPRLNWRLVEIVAMDPANLPRAMAGMGFTRSFGPMPRGGVTGFEPAYFRFRSTRDRTIDTPTVAARGLRAGAWPDDAYRAVDAADRARVAAINRALLRAPCRLMVRDAQPRIAIFIDETTGEWRDLSGGARGDTIIDLAAMMLGLPYGKAGYRLARLCGMAGVPEMADA